MVNMQKLVDRSEKSYIISNLNIHIGISVQNHENAFRHNGLTFIQSFSSEIINSAEYFSSYSINPQAE